MRWTLLSFAVFGVLGWLLMRRPRLPVPSAKPDAEMAKGEWYRIRRTPDTATRFALSFGRVYLALSVLFVVVLVFGVTRGELMYALLFPVVMFGFFGMYSMGAAPAAMYDCLASAEEIVHADLLHGERRYRRDEASVTIKAQKHRMYPFGLVLDDGAKKRRMMIDADGIATLRALGWEIREDSGGA